MKYKYAEALSLQDALTQVNVENGTIVATKHLMHGSNKYWVVIYSVDTPD